LIAAADVDHLLSSRRLIVLGRELLLALPGLLRGRLVGRVGLAAMTAVVGGIGGGDGVRESGLVGFGHEMLLE